MSEKKGCVDGFFDSIGTELMALGLVILVAALARKAVRR